MREFHMGGDSFDIISSSDEYSRTVATIKRATNNSKSNTRKKETVTMEMTSHDALLDILKVRKGDLMALLNSIEHQKLSTDKDKILKAINQIDDAIDLVFAQILIGQKRQMMSSGSVK